MPRRYRPNEARKVLESLGWRFSRQRGSHMIFVKEGEINHVTIPESRREMDKKTFGNMLRQAGLKRREFDRLAAEVL